eukprot:m.575011 g.575011  ORF g.575011 m.575011 type:complete len:153 (+) comp22284_c1_seq14:12-470(+)
MTQDHTLFGMQSTTVSSGNGATCVHRSSSKVIAATHTDIVLEAVPIVASIQRSKNLDHCEEKSKIIPEEDTCHGRDAASESSTTSSFSDDLLCTFAHLKLESSGGEQGSRTTRSKKQSSGKIASGIQVVPCCTTTNEGNRCIMKAVQIFAIN